MHVFFKSSYGHFITRTRAEGVNVIENVCRLGRTKMGYMISIWDMRYTWKSCLCCCCVKPTQSKSRCASVAMHSALDAEAMKSRVSAMMSIISVVA